MWIAIHILIHILGPVKSSPVCVPRHWTTWPLAHPTNWLAGTLALPFVSLSEPQPTAFYLIASTKAFTTPPRLFGSGP